jgi:3-deoxy-D-manno-octulosonic-acid transferase
MSLAERMVVGYVRLTGLAAPLGRLVVSARRRRGKEHPDRWPERLGDGANGDHDTNAGSGPMVWIHAASVGETVAVLPLVERIAATGARVLLTTVTLTSAGVAGARLPPGVTHRFVPLDIAPFVDAFLDTWNPDLAIFVESEIWPVAIVRLEERGIPLVVANARMSDRSFRKWSRAPGFAGALFGRIGLCLAQSGVDAERFRALGVGRAVDVGNIKFDAPVPEAAPADAEALARALAGRAVFLAASTHAGEDRVVFDAFEAVRATRPDTALVIAPRHPDRGGAVAAGAHGRGLSVVRRSTGALPGPDTAVYVADTIGELGTLYRLSSAAFVGGSLVDSGGHNPIEPARLGAPIIAGPHVGSFREPYAALGESGGVLRVADAPGLAAAVERLISDPVTRAEQVAAAAAVVERYTGALARTFEAIEPMLAPLVLASRLASGRERLR